MNHLFHARRLGGAFLINLLAAVTVYASEPAAASADDTTVARGRYLVSISGCNDCHTAGYPQSGGQIPEQDWLTGDAVGFEGPWGVSYPANLRLSMNKLTEEQWLAMARAERLPPMPWFSLARMTDDDLRAIYAFVKWLGPKGEVAPLALRPGDPVTTPVIVFVPVAPTAAPIAKTAVTATPSSAPR
jgi:mono/diheme cytochrome c family protein